MEVLSKEEIDRFCGKMSSITLRALEDDELSERLFSSIDHRVLTEQPEYTPQERYERLMKQLGKKVQ